MLKHNIIDNRIKNQRKKDIVYLILILLIASIGFLMLFSFGTSCLYNHKYIGKDSDIFLALGKFTKNGLVPYKDFFDHKGPYIIFVEWLGYIIGNGKSGVFVIQVISLLLTLLGVYKILRLFYNKKIWTRNWKNNMQHIFKWQRKRDCNKYLSIFLFNNRH